MRKLISLIAVALIASACSGGSTPVSPGPADMAKASSKDMAFQSACGHPGDKGNALGVGQFCMAGGDCANNTMANFCSSLGNTGGPDDAFFCTFFCKGDGGASQCGEGAYCNSSDPRASVCVPLICGGPMDGGSKG